MPILKGETTLYRPVFAAAWKRTWSDKWLWILGIFAAGSISGSALEVLSGNFSRGAVWSSGMIAGVLSGIRAQGYFVKGLDGITVVWIALLAALLFALTVFLVVISTVSYGTLIGAALHKKGAWSLSKIWHSSAKRFWSLFGIVLLTKIAVMLLVSLERFPLERGAGWVSALYPLYFVIVAALAVCVGFLGIYAAVALLRERIGFLNAWHRAFSILREHFLVSFEMAAALFGVGMVAAFLMLLGFFVAMTPALIFYMVGSLTGTPILPSLAVTTGLIVFLAYLLFLGAVYTALTITAWTMLYDRLTAGVAVSKLVRLWQWAFHRA